MPKSSFLLVTCNLPEDSYLTEEMFHRILLGSICDLLQMPSALYRTHCTISYI